MKISLLIFLLIASPSLWAKGSGPSKTELTASSDIDTLKTWKDLDFWRKKYAPKYDDGFYAEGISDFVERKLATNWGSLRKLVSLTARSPGLFEFAIGHLGEITGCANAKSIVDNATNNCPSGLEPYCNHIKEALVPRAAPECLPAPNTSPQPTQKPRG